MCPAIAYILYLYGLQSRDGYDLGVWGAPRRKLRDHISMAGRARLMQLGNPLA